MSPQDFQEACAARGWNLTSAQLQQFERYAELLVEWNEKMNLTAIVDKEEIREKHFLDSLLPFFDHPATEICDVGSGAGFPSIPLVLARPSTYATIVEPLNKRCRFLEEVCSQLGLTQVTILNERAEDHAKSHREAYPMVTARAVARLPLLEELCVPLVQVGGIFLAMKGPQGKEEAQEAKQASLLLGVKLEETQEIQGEEGTRINLFYRKEKKTPAAYPRNFGKMKKNPL